MNIGRYGQRVDAALQAGQDIAPILEEIALAVASALQQLPQRPTELVVTGGISRDPRLAAFHQRTAGIPVRQHATHHGTALGAASLLKASVRQNMEQ